MVQTSMFLRFRNISGNRVRVRIEEKDTIECAENETLQSNHGSGEWLKRRVACCVYDRREACPCVDGEALELNPLEQPKHPGLQDCENPTLNTKQNSGPREIRSLNKFK